jgi:hypothetical protein
MKAMPNKEEAGPEDFFPADTMQVPPMMASTAAYSLSEYLAPPSSREPIITGTILPDLAKVTTGKDTPEARARLVNAFAHTWVAPDMANIDWGRLLVLPERTIPIPPITTLARASEGI